MSVGLVVGHRYELTARLGRGGFGTVWQAHDATLRRDVAIKMITIAPEERDDIVARFSREAQAVASLNHPNIVIAHDFGIVDDSAYLVMELVTGGSLADELATRRMGGAPPLDLARVVTLGAQISAGLAAAHTAGLVHRDLKPANIMLVRGTGAVKIVDFGIAHISDASRLTKPGGYLGTLPYASPEQMSDAPVDGRSDLYSLGCLLYELLTDHSPYVAESPAQWIAAHQSAAATPLRHYLPNVSDALESLIHALLAKDPARRPPDAEVVRRLLEAALTTPAPAPLRPTLVDSRLPAAGTAQSPGLKALPAGPAPAVPVSPGAAPVASPRPPGAGSSPGAGVKPPGNGGTPMVAQPGASRPAGTPARAPVDYQKGRAIPAGPRPAPRPPGGSPSGGGAASPGRPGPRATPRPGSAPAMPYYTWQPVPTPQGWVVLPQLVTPPPAAVPRPITSTVAGRLLMALAILCGVEAVLVTAALVPVGKATQSAFSGSGSDAGTYVVVSMMVIAAAQITASVITGILAGSNLRGSRGGRLWTWIIGGLTLLVVLSGIGKPDGATVAATPRGTDLARPAVVRALTTVRAAIPSWYVSTAKLFDVLAAIILVLVLVLLALPPTGAYIRARRMYRLGRPS